MRLLALTFLVASTVAAQTALTITTTSLPDGTVGTPYPTTTLSATGGGGSASYRWSVIGALPPGLSLSTAGQISGTPTNIGTYGFDAVVSDTQGNSVSRRLSISISSSGTPQKPIVTTLSLAGAVVGQAYSQALTVNGGSPPYQWSVTQGALPAGLTLDRTAGTISGTPTATGTSTFQVQAVDSASQPSTPVQLAITVSAQPLTIITAAPLFVGTVGQSYAQSFAVSGGTKPYTWSIVSGDPGGLKLDAASGVLQGTPQTAGNFAFTVQVTDAAGARTTQAYSLTINAPSLVLTLGGQPAAGTVGVPYDQRLALVVTGGTEPVTWSVLSGNVPGLVFSPATLHLSGTPETAGTFNLTIQARDNAGLTASRAVTVVIAPGSLTIVTARQLPGVGLNGSYNQALTALGGTPPYSWSANGLPAGLSIDATTGVIAGTATAAGTFSAVITVRDAALNVFQDLFTIAVTLPPAPSIVLSGLPATVDPRQQIALDLKVSAAFPAAITGTAQLSFSPESGLPDRTVVFASGATSVKFTIPAGSTTPQFETPLMLQTGTVAGTLSVTLNYSAASLDITPQPAPAYTAQIVRAAPVITDVQVTRAAGSLSAAITGYATSREITQAVFAFSAASGQTLQSSASSITVDVTNLFSTWYQNAATSAYGSQFAFTQPFTISGDSNAVSLVSVTLKNKDGSTTFTVK